MITEFTEALSEVPQAYSAVNTLSVVLRHDCKYPKEHKEKLQEKGASGVISPPDVAGDYRFFTKGANFGWNVNTWYEDGAVVNDCSGAWNGKIWQFLDRSRDSKHVLSVKSSRSGSQEGIGLIGFPYHYAFSFLAPNFERGAANPKEIIEALPNSSMSLEKLANPSHWSEFIQDAKSIRIEDVESLGGRHVVVQIERGYFPDRVTKSGWKVFFDIDHVTFPVRVDRYDASTSELINRFEVVGPMRKVAGLDVPESYKLSTYNPSLGIDVPYRIEEFSGVSFLINGEIDDESFGFDASTVSRVKDLDSGRTIIVE
jgi:hypothetical protein